MKKHRILTDEEKRKLGFTAEAVMYDLIRKNHIVEDELRNKIIDELDSCTASIPYAYIVDWIDIHCNNFRWSTLDKKAPSASSYGLKHMIERSWGDGYCTNAATKLALVELGFDVFPIDYVDDNGKINKYKGNDNYCSNIDILPTLLNLFGVEYDSRLIMGRDILSNNDGMIVFGNRNIVTKNYKYSNMNEYIDGSISLDEIKEIKNNIYMKYRISRLMLENDYYRYLFKD